MVLPVTTVAGDTFAIYGAGFTAGEQVVLEWSYATTTGGPQKWSQPVDANAAGAIFAAVPIPLMTIADGYVVKASVGGAVVAVAPIFIRRP